MIYQLSWQTLPGLRGLSCSNFRAVATGEPDRASGVALECASGVTLECASEAECAGLLESLEVCFGAQRFSNNAAAFEAVKAYVMDRSTKNR